MKRVADQVPGSAGGWPAEIQRASTAAVAGALSIPVLKCPEVSQALSRPGM